MRKIFFFGFLIFILVSAQEWEWLHPSPTGVNLKGVWFFNQEVGIVCGEAGTILKTTDGGETWQKISSPTFRNLNDIHFINENKGFIVGDSAIILITEDGGQTWTRRQITPYNHFLAIDFPRSDTGFLCGYNGKIYRTTNSGTSFASQNSGVTEILYDISFPPNNATIGYACGYNGTILKTTDGGQTWTGGSVGNIAFFSLDFPENPNVGYVAGDYGQIKKTTDGGLTWQGIPSGTSNPIKSIRFLNNNIGFYCGNNGTIRKTTNGGNNWVALSVPVSVNLNKIYLLNENVIFVVGDCGTILKSTDGGENWQLLTRVIAYNNWTSICFPDANTGFVCGGLSPAGMRTNDGGRNWEIMDMSNMSWQVNALYFTSTSNGAAVGDAHDNILYVSYTTNGGYSWATPPITPPDTFSKYALHFPTTSIGYACGERGSVIKTTNGGRNWSPVANAGTGRNFAVFFTDANTGFVGGGYGIYRTTNGGSGWIRTLDSVVYSIYFLNSQTGFACGNNGKIYKTTNGGSSWTIISTPATRKLNSIFFIGNTGYAGGDMGTFLKTTDGGNTWTLEPIPFKGNINAIWMIDENEVFVCGVNGAILKRMPTGIKENENSHNVIFKKKINSQYLIYNIAGNKIKEIKKKGIYFIKEKKGVKKIVIF